MVNKKIITVKETLTQTWCDKTILQNKMYIIFM